MFLLSICPLCAALGYLTPALIDRYAGGRPADAGRAYALNVLGCILGPLFASYVLLPRMSERLTLLLLAIPFLAFYLILEKQLLFIRRAVWGLAIGAGMIAALFSWNLETLLQSSEQNIAIRRDYAASVISAGQGFRKILLVNGLGMTALTPITKFMSHLPLALHQAPPESALIICFGMGTSYRSALSWNVDTTVVELVPSVTKAFGFYHPDTERILINPLGHIVIDDGRRFLKRTTKGYDAIVVDPPPPIQAAGSSLLYSEEFYEQAKRHLKPNGIVQAWFPGGDAATLHAVARSIHNSFPFVRVFPSVHGWGYHFFASMEPIEMPSTDELMARMPEAAQHDLLEWTQYVPLRVYLERVLLNEVSMESLLDSDESVRLTDDRPYNEYYLMRRLGLRSPAAAR